MELQGDTSFGQWLKQRRKAFDLTQKELAQRVECAEITIQKIEANERRPSKQIAKLLAGQLDIAVDERPAFVRFARLGSSAHFAAQVTRARRRLTNLPAQPTPLIGRDQDVAAVRQRLQHSGSRLLTLVGPPGVGKTCLAIQAASGLLDEYSDGIFFIPLAPVDDAQLVATAIAQTLGVNEIKGQSYADRLQEYLRDRHMLLVLDNFEQLLAAAPLLSELAAECLWLNMLVTSRAPLRLRRERQFPVSPLPLPARKTGLDLDEYAHCPAITLFIERARAIKYEFALTANNAAAIAAICTRLDGLPLAIELVAARAKVLPAESLLERLDRWLILHTDGLRDVSIRHRTLYNAIDWSYALLDSQAQSLLTRSGVFVGGWTLEAAEWLTRDTTPHDSPATLEALTSLVDNNLVVLQEHNGQPRFTLLQTVRAYALERLAERGEEEQVRRQHAGYYLALAEEAAPHLHSAIQKEWLDRLDSESGNLRSALTWVIERSPDVETGLRLVGALMWYWTIRGRLGEGRRWSHKALQKNVNDVQPQLRAHVVAVEGSFAWQQGELSAARSLFEQSVALYREVNPAQQRGLVMALSGMAMVAAYQADHDATQDAAEEAVALSHRKGDKWGLALALNPLGEACMLRHDYAEARLRFAESLALFRELGDKFGMGVPLLNWGYMDSLQGDYDSARTRLEESIALHREVGEFLNRSYSLNILAQVAQQQGDFQEAAQLYDESLDLLQKMGLESNTANVLYNLAHMAQAQGHHQLSARLYQESLDLFAKQGDEQGVSKCRAGLAALN